MVASAALVPRAAAGDELVDSVHGVLMSVFRRSHPVLEGEGISMGQFWALHMISSLGSAPMGTIARGLGVSSPTVCAKIDELEAAGLVARHRSERDRRVVELSLTTKGRRTEARVWSWIGRMMGEAAVDLPHEDLATAIRVFHAIQVRLDQRPARTGGRP
jgi:DNA-binding MarR family transcriptional regulator